MSSSTSITPESTPTGISPSSSPSVAISAYFFGFLIILVVLLFVTVGCCFSRWRPGVLLGTPWDTRDQLDGRSGRRRKLIPPVLWDTWLSHPPALTEEVLDQSEWSSIQPVSASLIRSCHSPSAHQFAAAVSESEIPADPSTVAPLFSDDFQSSLPLPLPLRRRSAFPLAHPSNFHVWLQRRSRARRSSAASENPTEDEIENRPKAVEVAVMISMPSATSRCWNNGGDPLSHSAASDDVLREYQIGVTQVPWIPVPNAWT
ncbi:hypothetical protein BDR07DRAFT_1476826 [Suillus spraguei]|nr:hypothetical protein BDR07DRAFT_1476826 [Suillus spraguei]